MAARGWGALAAAAALATGVVACGSAAQHGTQVRAIAIATPGSHNDLDWTRQARAAFEAIAERGHLRGLVADGVSTADAPAVLAGLAARHPQLLIAHEPSFAAAAVRTAKATGVPVLVWGDRSALEPGKVGDVEVEAAAGGYVAGVLAAEATGIKKVAIVIGDEGTAWDETNWNRYAGGFIAGARHAVPHVQIKLVRVAGATPQKVKAATTRVLRDGVQTIFALAGTSAIGALRAIDRTTGEQEYAGVIGDKATVNAKSDVVTSVVYAFPWLFRRAIADVRTGRFGKQVYTLGLANGGLHLLETGRTPMNAYEGALSARRAILRRRLSVPDSDTSTAVRGLLALRR